MSIPRAYPFAVRPHHKETLDSYGQRVLDANFENSTHRNQHITTYLATQDNATVPEAWFAVLEAKTGRDLSRLLTAEPVTHTDGTMCEKCVEGIETRHLCTLCAHGADVTQHPHFDQNVCITHRRWVGPGTRAADQTSGGPSLVNAELTFRKLRRQGRIDAPVFLAFRRALTGTDAASPRDALLYPALIHLVALLTSASFGRELFDPNRTFATAFALLTDTVRDTIEDGYQAIARRLWLYLRPTFLSVREHLTTGEPLARTAPHDFPLRPETLAGLLTPMRPLEPFARYLAVTGDTTLQKDTAREVLEHPSASPATPPRAVRTLAIICRRGHRFMVKEPALLRDTATGRENCPVCEHRTVQPGETSMAMTHPGKAQWFHPTANAPLTADTVFAHSHWTVQWRCAAGHEFPASPTNFVHSIGGCTICLNRIVILGVNCLPSKYPDIAREWHPTRNIAMKVDAVAAGSNFMAWWLCTDGHHEFRMSVGDRTRGKNCPQCKTAEFLARSIQNARPDWLPQWHPTKNLPLQPADVTVGSRVLIVWVCSNGHEFEQRPERRAAGYGCSTCSNRKVTRGVNDARTRYPKTTSEWHPYLNGSTTPDRILPGTEKYWWKCLASGHKYHQSIPHRVASHGCPVCKPDDRIGPELWEEESG